jgi:hypothetical protein
MAEMSPEEKLEKIYSICLDLLEKYAEKSEGSEGDSVLVKSIGEALKSLAEGLESCKTVVETPKEGRVLKSPITNISSSTSNNAGGTGAPADMEFKHQSDNSIRGR